MIFSLFVAALNIARPDLVRGLTGASNRWHSATPVAPAPDVLPAANTDAPVPSPDGVTAALNALLNDADLGGRVTASVLDAGTSQPLYSRDAQTATVPASTAKILVAAAVLATRGPGHRISTTVVAGSSPGEVVLVGAGDATLSAAASGRRSSYSGAARLDELATQVRKSMGDTPITSVIVDSSLFTGPVFGPGWDPDIASEGFAAPIMALMVDGARTSPVGLYGPTPRSSQPDLAAGQAFAEALGGSTIAVSRGAAPADATQLGAVQSAPMVRMVDDMLTESDNVLAECLARQVALARNGSPSFTGATDAIRSTLTSLGVSADGFGMVDGSGLSRNNRLTPALLTNVLAAAASADHPELRSVFSGLPVAGYSGTLKDRYRRNGSGGGAGVVRAKTGTLSGVSAIAGIAIDTDGRTLAFAFMADGVQNTLAAQEALDRIAAALASCGCR